MDELGHGLQVEAGRWWWRSSVLDFFLLGLGGGSWEGVGLRALERTPAMAAMG